MKKLLHFSILIFIGLYLVSCGGSNEDPQPAQEGFIRFKVDGILKEFKVGLGNSSSFSFDPNGPIFNTIIQVLGPGSTGTSNFIQFTVKNEKMFETNLDYNLQDAILYKGVPLSRINFVYSDEKGQSFAAVNLDPKSPLIVVKDAAKVRFSKITNDVVEGTFTALLIGPITPTGVGKQEVTISEGQFSMKLTNLIP
ncbi:hypothetical protein [Algoriphagus sp.]|uniref:hypothetical protein n=1 Tax=Algoriphagus sp. TaxID=1872435 RepID=UPI00391D4651